MREKKEALKVLKDGRPRWRGDRGNRYSHLGADRVKGIGTFDQEQLRNGACVFVEAAFK